MKRWTRAKIAEYSGMKNTFQVKFEKKNSNGLYDEISEYTKLI